MSLEFSGAPLNDFIWVCGYGKSKKLPHIWKIEEAHPGFRRVSTKWRKIGQIMWKNRKNDNAVDVFEINSQKFASRLILGWGIRLWSHKFNIPKIWPSCCDVIFPYLGKKGTKIEFHFLAKTLWETPKNWYSGWFWDDGSEYELKFWVFLIFHRLLWRHITLFGHKWEKAENFPQIKVKPDKVIILMYKLVWHVFGRREN